MGAIEDVIAAAQSNRKLRFPLAGQENLGTLAHQFDARNEGSFRQWLGGDQKATRVVDDYSPQINAATDAVRHDPTLASSAVPTQLIQSIMYVENNYNGGSWWGSKTPLPMNVNYNAWQEVLGHQSPPITKNDLNDPQKNIHAAAVILSTINASIDPSITGNERWALVASMYGSTEHTIQAGRAIMYGGKVEQVMEKRYPLPAPQQQTAPARTSGTNDISHTELMALAPTPAPAPTRATVVAI